MKLKSYLADINMSVKDLASMIGYAPGYISLVMHYHKKPGKKICKLINELTRGEVDLLKTWNENADKVIKKRVRILETKSVDS